MTSCSVLTSLVLVGLLSAHSFKVTEARTYYVKPETDTKRCPYKPCETLKYYTNTVAEFFTTNTTFIFLEGTHQLWSDKLLLIEDISRLTLRGNGQFITGIQGLLEPSSRIECKGKTGFSFKNITNLSVKLLTFVACGGVWNRHKYAALLLYAVIDLTITEVTVRNCIGYGVSATSVLGNSSISKSTFAYNTGTMGYYGGNIQLFYKKCLGSEISYLRISSSNFLYGINPHGGAFASGLSLLVMCTNVKITIMDSFFRGNTAYSDGGNLALDFHNATHHFPSDALTLSNSYIEDGVSHRGGGVYVNLLQASIPGNNTCNFTDIFHFRDTHFVGNSALKYGGGLYFNSITTSGAFCSGGNIIFDNCTFYNNSVFSREGGAAAHITTYKVPGYIQHGVPQLQTAFKRCNFSHSNPHSVHYASTGAVFIYEVDSVEFLGCSFEDNNSTALIASHSNIIFQGSVRIHRNTGVIGGGLLLCGGSLMYLQANTSLILTNNKALHSGGGIYVEDDCMQPIAPCFFQFPSIKTEFLETIHVEIVNNTALYAGSDLYGGSVDSCRLLLTWLDIKVYFNKNFVTSKDIFNKVFHVTPKSDKLHSIISSNPYRVCHCSGSRPVCRSTAIRRKVYPGETFTTKAIVVGQKNGAVPGDVIATLTNGTMYLGRFQDSQTISKPNCDQLNYTIFSNHSTYHSKSVHLLLTVQQPVAKGNIPQASLPHPTYIIIKFKKCPLGFALSQAGYCGCVPFLADNGVECNITRQTILRHPPVWIGHELSSNIIQTTVIVFHHCPFDFCLPHDVSIPTTKRSFLQDKQCAYNRTRVLCGACQEGLSVVLGTSQCLPCSNYYLLLLLVFGAAGLVLVILLTLCNLTVSEGTINGLVFYVNIVQINAATFFPPTQMNSFSKTLQVFVAWLNLDLGITTCFYDGMNAYVKAWMQFVFPVYIWLIAAMIIILSRRYSTVTRLVGRNAVKVLATLFLLSYAKLLRSIITALSFAVLSYSTEQTEVVWLYDGNINYFQGKHIPLAVTALVFGTLSLPYACVLFFIRCLQRGSNFRLLFWVRKLKPLFDAYSGPYTDKTHFWTGLLLLVRISLFTLFAINVFGEQVINTMVTAIVCLALLVLAWFFRSGIYKKMPLDILESSFLLNLGALCIATTYSQKSANEYQAIFTYCSVATALVTFIGIVTYHTYTQLVTWRCFRRRRLHHSPEPEVLEPLLANNNDEQEPHIPMDDWPPFVRFDQDREPLLAEENEN